MALAVLSLVALAGAVQSEPTSFKVGQAVNTASGLVNGRYSTWMPVVSEYLGIPYAQPPIGPLRFAAPKPYIPDGIINATKFSPDCPANVLAPKGASITYETVAATIGGILGQAGDDFSEDCLTLNVWTKPQSGEKAKAVMVWIYGGGFNTGNSQSPAYNGARLANEKDVVVVSMNYRVNIFGFHGNRNLPDLNPGLLDQRLAVEWVRDNIAAFGGDPKRITLFGQSAGGASVDMYSYAWTKDPIVSGLIPESGSVSLGPSSANNSASWYAASKALNCGGEEAGLKTVDCMRGKPFGEILAGIKTIGGANPMGAFGPKADGKVVFSDYAARSAAGNFIKAPVLVGNTDDEGGLSVALASYMGASKPPSRHIARQTPPKAPNLAMIGCGPHAAALARTKAGVPAWRYVYNGVYPNQDIGSKGAWHGADIGMQFGTNEFLSKQPNTEVENKMEQTVLDAWTTFAKDPKDGLKKKLSWPTYDADKPTVISLGGRNDASVKFIERKAIDKTC